MLNKIIITFLAISIISIVSGCGKTEKTPKQLSTVDFLPKKLSNLDIQRSDDVSVFVGDSLYEYINGGAELYHHYKFVDVATATYKHNDAEIVADLYRFATEDLAYGLYTNFRPDNGEYLPLGVEGFGSESSRDFVKGAFMVRLIGYDTSEDTKTAIAEMAPALAALLPGTMRKPEMFSKFPVENIIPGTDKLHAESFMGQKSLTEIYAQSFAIEGDTLQLFFAFDGDGNKLSAWKEALSLEETKMSAPKGLPFEQNNSFIYSDLFYGTVATGKIGSYIAGISGYSESHNQFISNWLNTMAQ